MKKNTMTEKEYRRSQGLDSKDIGSNYLKRKEIVRRLKLKNGKTARIWKLKKAALYMVILKTN